MSENEIGDKLKRGYETETMRGQGIQSETERRANETERWREKGTCLQ